MAHVDVSGARVIASQVYVNKALHYSNGTDLHVINATAAMNGSTTLQAPTTTL